MFVEVTYEGKPEGEKNLFSCPATESLWVPDHTSGVVDIKPGFISGRGDLYVSAFSKSSKPVRCFNKRGGLVMPCHFRAGAF